MKLARWLGASERARVLSIIALSALPLLLVAAILLWRNALDAEERIVRDRIGLARSAALVADTLIDHELAHLHSIAIAPVVRDTSRVDEVTQFLAESFGTNPNTSGLGLFGADGWNVAMLGGEPRTHYVGDRSYFQEVLATGLPTVSPALINRVTNAPAVMLAVPVEFADGARGALVSSLMFERLAEQLQLLPEHDAIQFIVVDAFGQAFVHPDPAISRSLTSLRGRPDVDAVLAGESGALRVVQADSSQLLAAYAPAKRAGWGVVVAEPVDSAFGLIYSQMQLTTGAFAVAGLLAMLTGWYLGGRLSRSYEAERAARAQALANAAELRRISAISEGRRRFLERLIATSPVAIAVYRGPELRYETVNDRFRAFKPDVEMVGRRIDEVFPEFVRQGIVDRLRNSYVTGESYTAVDMPVEIEDASGATQRRYFTIVRARFEDLVGEPAGLIVYAVDTTEATLHRQQLEREKDDFLSTASHELKTPLAALGLAAQMTERMLDQEQLDVDRVRRYLMTIREQVQRMTRLVGDLLDVSRLQEGRLHLAIGRVDLVALASHVIQRQRDLLGDESMHEIRLHRATAEVVIAGDEDRLEQVLTNLLSNAVKYSPDGGPIDVEVGSQDGTAWIRVVDHGMGVPPEECDALFAPFNRTRAARESGVEGTGLGLYITWRIVRAHGGTIRYLETPGGGATFEITLPVERGTASAPSEQQPGD